jgi:hypothetical protein
LIRPARSSGIACFPPNAGQSQAAGIGSSGLSESTLYDLKLDLEPTLRGEKNNKFAPNCGLRRRRVLVFRYMLHGLN